MDEIESELPRIARYVSAAYGTGPEPTFTFVQDVLDRNPYAALLQELPVGCTVSEDTDLNDDVSFAYLISCKPFFWRLALSMVGPYAVLIRSSAHDRRPRIVAPAAAPADAREAALLALLRRHSVTVLDEDTLRQPLPLGGGAHAPTVTVYQALITDSENIP